MAGEYSCWYQSRRQCEMDIATDDPHKNLVNLYISIYIWTTIKAPLDLIPGKFHHYTCIHIISFTCELNIQKSTQLQDVYSVHVLIEKILPSSGGLQSLYLILYYKQQLPIVKSVGLLLVPPQSLVEAVVDVLVIPLYFHKYGIHDEHKTFVVVPYGYSLCLLLWTRCHRVLCMNRYVLGQIAAQKSVLLVLGNDHTHPLLEHSLFRSPALSFVRHHSEYHTGSPLSFWPVTDTC